MSKDLTTETERYVIHHEPRLSATKLAEYVVADPSRKKTILRQAKNAQKSIILQYRHVRNALPHAFSGGGFMSHIFSERAAALDLQRGGTLWSQGDITRSAVALRNLAELAPQIEFRKATMIHRPENGWRSLKINGVKVSVQPSLVFSMIHGGITKVGGIILNTAGDDGLSLARRNDKYCIGDYLTALLYTMLETHLKPVGHPSHTKCYAIDVFRKCVYPALPNHKTLNRHIEDACETIALQWATIPVAEAFPEPVESEA